MSQTGFTAAGPAHVANPDAFRAPRPAVLGGATVTVVTATDRLAAKDAAAKAAREAATVKVARAAKPRGGKAPAAAPKAPRPMTKAKLHAHQHAAVDRLRKESEALAETAKQAREAAKNAPKPVNAKPEKPEVIAVPMPASLDEYVDAVRARRMAPGEAAIRHAAQCGTLPKGVTLAGALAGWAFFVLPDGFSVPSAFTDAARGTGGVKLASGKPAPMFGYSAAA